MARHTQEQDRCVTGEVGDVLDQVEARLLAPVQVVEDANERLLGRDSLQQLAERPGDLLARGDDLLVADQGAQCLARDLIHLGRRELLHHLDHGPVGDALAVGEAAAAADNDGVPQRGQELGRQA